MRANAKPNDVLRALAKAIEATFARGDWLDLALLTDTERVVSGHRRLLRSLEWNDPDYSGNVLDVLPAILGDRGLGHPHAVSAAGRFPNLRVVEDRVGLQQWLGGNEPVLYEALYGGEDKVVLDDLQEASERLGLPDVSMHAARIRRSIREDPAQAIGSAKELLETTLKAVLGLHGTGPETRIAIPQLVKRANLELGLDAASIDGTEPGAQHRRRVLGSLAQVVNSTAELRNEGFGTGHGVSRGPELDVATARMVVAAAVTVATFYVEAHAVKEEQDSGPTVPF
jgi:hypothetical protein